METEKMKTCPCCGETILFIAKKCKHCGEWLEDKSESSTFEEEGAKVNQPVEINDVSSQVDALTEAINVSTTIIAQHTTKEIKNVYFWGVAGVILVCMRSIGSFTEEKSFVLDAFHLLGSIGVLYATIVFYVFIREILKEEKDKSLPIIALCTISVIITILDFPVWGDSLEIHRTIAVILFSIVLYALYYVVGVGLCMGNFAKRYSTSLGWSILFVAFYGTVFIAFFVYLIIEVLESNAPDISMELIEKIVILGGVLDIYMFKRMKDVCLRNLHGAIVT
jgi:hypothetical protein